MGCTPSSSTSIIATTPAAAGCGQCPSPPLDPRDSFGNKTLTDTPVATLSAATAPAHVIQAAPPVESSAEDAVRVTITGETIDSDGSVVYHLKVPLGQVTKRFEEFVALHDELAHVAMTACDARGDVVATTGDPSEVKKLAGQEATTWLQRWLYGAAPQTSTSCEDRRTQRDKLQAMLDAAMAHPTALNTKAFRQFVAVNL